MPLASNVGADWDDATIDRRALLFGQFLSDRPFSWALAVGSLAVWASLLATTFYLVAEEEE